MEKKSIFGFVLIGVILIGWLYWTSSQQPKQPPKKQTVENKVDSTKKETTPKPDTLSRTSKDFIAADSLKNDSLSNEYGSLFYSKSIKYDKGVAATEKVMIVENAKVYIEFSTFGGSISKYILKDFKTWEGKPLQLVNWDRTRELNLLFTSKQGKLINTRDLIFNSSYTDWQKADIEKDSTFKLRYELPVSADGSQKITKIYSFKKDSYEFEVDFEISNSDKFITGSKYQLVWGSSLNLTEYRSDDESTFAEAFAYMGGELDQLDATKFNEEFKSDVTGNTDYVSSRNKYFGVYIIPKSRKGDGAYLTGKKDHLKDEGVREDYSIGVKMDIKNESLEKSSFAILITPLDYKILKAYDMDLEKTMRFALDFIVRPIAQYFIMPFFSFLHTFIPNYGLVIILFAISLKILLNPLTKKQMQSMKKMSALNPKMTAIREKHKGDSVKANQQIMKLYKEEKINPAGGCLPMLLQLPILYALFGVFRSTIELRQAPFIWWIQDLAAPDILFHLPFKIPIFGIDMISGLATLMGITMFIQQKMTVTDPKQKALVYMMPVMMTLLFFSLPSGLNLYYFIFNLLSIIQQYYTTHKKSKEEIVVMKGNAKK